MRKSREQEVIEGNGLSFEDKVTLMLWGDSKLGVRGLKGRMDRTERWLIGGVLLTSFLALVLTGHLGWGFTGEAGLVGALLKSLFGL